LEEGKDKYAKGDKMGALRLWERCLKQVRPCCLSLRASKLRVHNYDTPSTDTSGLQDPSLEQRQAAHFNSTAVHASFGDVELAQITLRGRMQAAAAACRSCDLQTLKAHSE